MFIHPSHYVGIEELLYLSGLLSLKINTSTIKKNYHISAETNIFLQSSVDMIVSALHVCLLKLLV